MASGTIVRTSIRPAARAWADTGGTGTGSRAVRVGLASLVGGRLVTLRAGLEPASGGLVVALAVGRLVGAGGRSATAARVQPVLTANSARASSGSRIEGTGTSFLAGGPDANPARDK